MLTINTLNMAKTVVKQIPRQLHPRGEHIIKIVYSDEEPPKNRIWGIDDDLFEWNGKEWVPFELVPRKKPEPHCNCNSKMSDCDLNAKLEKYKKDLLTAVLKLIKKQHPDGESALADRVAQLESDVAALKQINHDLFVKNTELDSLLQQLGYVKSSQIENRFTTLENTVANHETRISNIENAHYATQTYVDNAIANINVPTKTSQLINDSSYVSGFEVINTPTETVLGNNDTFSIFTGFDVAQSQGIYKLRGARSPYRLNISGGSGSQYDDSELRGRVETLENAGFITSSALTGINGRLDTLEGDELVTSASLNDLNSRTCVLEESHLATQSWVEDNYEPKFTDLTNEADPVATAQTHSSDNKVYITGIENNS